MKTPFAIVTAAGILVAGISLPSLLRSETPPAPGTVKNSKDLLRKWAPTRSAAAPKVEKHVAQMSRSEFKRLQSAAAAQATRGLRGAGALRGIEIVPTSDGGETDKVPVSINIDQSSLVNFPNIRFKLDSTDFADD